MGVHCKHVFCVFKKQWCTGQLFRQLGDEAAKICFCFVALITWVTCCWETIETFDPFLCFDFVLRSHCEQPASQRKTIPAELRGQGHSADEKPRRPRNVFTSSFCDRQLSTATQIRSKASLFPCRGIFNSWASWQGQTEWETDWSQTNLPLLDKTISPVKQMQMFKCPLFFGAL